VHETAVDNSSQLNFDLMLFNVTCDTRIGEEFQRVSGHDWADDGAVDRRV